ncbi:MAG TPA: PilX N-terminal domain-containing pilus assembly protein [Alphaproteobacteria bacterium]|nr:PilX N-terminal domain-containing pilus assembly protein [Alphaproteobacteria bacterium]
MRLNELSTTSHHQGQLTLTYRSSFVGQGPKAFAKKAPGTDHRRGSLHPGILPSYFAQENGMVTALGLLMLAVLTLLGTTAVVVTSTDIQIGGNYKVSETAFYAAEAGLEEARARLRGNAGANLILDEYPTSSQWRAYIGPLTKAQEKGFISGNAQHILVDTQSDLNYVVEIKHKTNDAGDVLYWGDHDGDGIKTRHTDSSWPNIYAITSTGYTANSSRTVEAEVTRPLPIPVPSPLYVKAQAKIHGNSTIIKGEDGCGKRDSPGVITTKDSSSIELQGNPKITGQPVNIQYNGPNIDVTSLVEELKENANYTYIVTGKTETGRNWGKPEGTDQQTPSTCSVSNIIYYNTQGTHIKLTGQTSGCGILLVDGDLEVEGGFAWHGIILVTGTATYRGGAEKHVTGGIMAGASMEGDLDDVGGNTSIVYCSSAIDNQTFNLPLRMLSWKE